MSAPLIFAVLFLSICSIILILDFFNLFRKFARKNVEITGVNINKTIVFISCIIILVTFLWDVNYLDFKRPVSHKDYSEITFSDFKGIKKPFELLDGEGGFAYIFTQIRTREISTGIEIEALFHPSRSYVYNKKLFSNNLLTHEMYHFHITEYFARLMRKEVTLLDEEGGDINLDKIKKRILKEERIMQQNYDEETYHSYVFGKQVEWQKKIDSCLIILKKYSNSKITVKKYK